MGQKGKDKGLAEFEAVRHSDSGSGVEDSKKKEQNMKLRHAEIRGAMDAGTVTFEQAGL
jgi:hypothetical protein